MINGQQPLSRTEMLAWLALQKEDVSIFDKASDDEVRNAYNEKRKASDDYIDQYDEIESPFDQEEKTIEEKKR